MKKFLLGPALYLFLLEIILPAYAHAQSSTITCTPGSKKGDGIFADYWAWGAGAYTYTPGGGYNFGFITEEYGTLDAKGNFTTSLNGGPFQATVDKTKLTWDGSANQWGLRKGQSIWIRATLWEVNAQKQMRVAAQTISKYTAPNN